MTVVEDEIMGMVITRNIMVFLGGAAIAAIITIVILADKIKHALNR